MKSRAGLGSRAPPWVKLLKIKLKINPDLFHYIFMAAMILQAITAITLIYLEVHVGAAAVLLTLIMFAVSYMILHIRYTILHIRYTTEINDSIKYLEKNVKTNDDYRARLECCQESLKTLIAITDCFNSFQRGKIQLGEYINEMHKLLTKSR